MSLMSPQWKPQVLLIAACFQLGDPMGQATAQMNVADLRKVLGLPSSDLSPDSLELVSTLGGQPSPALQRYRVRRQSMEQLDLFKV